MPNRQTARQCCPNCKNQGSCRTSVYRSSRSDGEPFYASVNMSQLVLQGNEVLLTLVEDVTDRIMAKQEAAVLEERERLARELHDAVTQTLFSASMMAEAVPDLWENNPTMPGDNTCRNCLGCCVGRWRRCAPCC